MPRQTVAPGDEPTERKLPMRMIKYWERMVDLWWYISLKADEGLARTIDISLHQAYRRWYCDIIPWSGDPRI